MVQTTLVSPRDLRSRTGTCNIIFKSQLFAKFGADKLILDVLGRTPTSCVLITDSTVKRLHGSKIKDDLEKIAKTKVVSLPPGERSKTLVNCIRILSELAKFGLDKEGVIVTLGGGVVGDIGGFAAAIYKRGVDYVQIPTTLLAQVDSSIGGKTGVDTKWGKNQIGRIYYPLGVLIDPTFLRTLPRAEYLNGIGEIVKYGVTSSEGIFCELEANNFESGFSDVLDLIEPCCKIKANIVSEDANDIAVRSILNYGHTIGHAIEAGSDYTIPHGISVLLGMLCEGWISRELGIFDSIDFKRQEKLIGRIFSKHLTDFRLGEGRIVKFALTDKKLVGGVLKMALPEKIGTMHKLCRHDFKTPVPLTLLKPSIAYAKKCLNI